MADSQWLASVALTCWQNEVIVCCIDMLTERSDRLFHWRADRTKWSSVSLTCWQNEVIVCFIDMLLNMAFASPQTSNAFIVHYTVYIIYSRQKDIFYVGYSNNVHRRLVQHNAGQANYTSSGVPWQLIWCCLKDSKREALQLEKKLKNLTRKRKIRFMQKYGEGLQDAKMLNSISWSAESPCRLPHICLEQMRNDEKHLSFDCFEVRTSRIHRR